MALVRRVRSEEEQAALRERAELHARWAQQDAAARAAACARREALTKLSEDVEEFNRRAQRGVKGLRILSLGVLGELGGSKSLEDPPRHAQ